MFKIEEMFSLLERIDKQYCQYKKLINEADSRLKAVDRIIDQVFTQYINPDDTVNDSEYYVNNNPNTTWRQYLIYDLRHTFNLMENSDVKYLPVVARLAYSDEVKFDITNDNGEEIRTLQRIVNLFKKDDGLFNEIKNNSNITFGQLADKFKEVFSQEDAADAEEANRISGGHSDYIVKEVTDFKTAHYYGNMSCSSSKLCYTESESTWNEYTSNGMNRVYVCLRNGWQNIPEEPTEGNPYDTYGTSMIFVFINPNGNLVTSNCRWNHHIVGKYINGCDQAFTKTTLSQTIGMPFDSVFKPKNINISALIEEGHNLKNIAIGDFVIPDGVTHIGKNAFYCCNKLTSVTIPDSVTSIEEQAFTGCSALTSVTISNSVTSIDDFAFSLCGKLTSINIPDSVTSIGECAFFNCYELTNVTIGSGLTSISSSTFMDCRRLKSITIPDAVTSIGVSAFTSCSTLTSVTIGNGVTSIDDYAFNNCKSLTEVRIPNSVKSIGEFVFSGCSSLTSVIIPNSVKEIGIRAFNSCDKLTIYTEDLQTARLVRHSGFNGNIIYFNE